MEQMKEAVEHLEIQEKVLGDHMKKLNGILNQIITSSGAAANGAYEEGPQYIDIENIHNG